MSKPPSFDSSSREADPRVASGCEELGEAVRAMIEDLPGSLPA